jgi:S1-C subfamily serine protease
VIGAAALLTALATLAGVGIGYAVWQPSTTAPASATSPISGGSRPVAPGTTGSSGGRGFSSGGSPFGGGSGSSNGSGSSGGSTSSAAGSPSNLSSIATGVDPGLVDINTTLSYQDEEAAGTGMVLTSNGEVLTNNHVIEGATSISVTDIGNGKTYTASVVGYDRTHDVAVIQLHGASGLQTVTTGDSSKVAVGEGVVGIGNAGGAGGTPSVAGGSVTALSQSITASDEGDGTSEQLTGLIEVNSDIQPGDSGGPLVDTGGQVVGMDTAASSSQGFTFQDATGQGYAIPINTALTIAKQIEAGSSSSTVHIGATAFLGVEIQASASGQTGQGSSGNGDGRGGVSGGGFGRFGGAGEATGPTGTGNSSTSGTSTATTTAGQGNSSTAGADVAGVVASSPAQKAGLADGDVITAVNGTTVSSADDLTTVMMGHHPGDKVQVTWTDSAGQPHTATVTLATGPAD